MWFFSELAVHLWINLEVAGCDIEMSKIKYTSNIMCKKASLQVNFTYGLIMQCPKLRFYFHFCVTTGCTSHKTVHPGVFPCTFLICSNDK